MPTKTRLQARFSQNAESRCSLSMFFRWMIAVPSPCSTNPSMNVTYTMAIATTPKSRGPSIAASTNVKSVVKPR